MKELFYVERTEKYEDRKENHRWTVESGPYDSHSKAQEYIKKYGTPNYMYRITGLYFIE